MSHNINFNSEHFVNNVGKAVISITPAIRDAERSLALLLGHVFSLSLTALSIFVFNSREIIDKSVRNGQK